MGTCCSVLRPERHERPRPPTPPAHSASRREQAQADAVRDAFANGTKKSGDRPASPGVRWPTTGSRLMPPAPLPRSGGILRACQTPTASPGATPPSPSSLLATRGSASSVASTDSGQTARF